MGFRIALAGLPNTGKSFSRKRIKDGENVMVLASSVKAPHLTTSDGKPVRPLSIKTKVYDGWDAAVKYYAETKDPNVKSPFGVIQWVSKTVSKGKFTRENLPGNFRMVKKLEHLEIWMKFINDYMPWIHTIILPDFTHYISEIISKRDFIDRKAGGEAYQRFWELAGDALRGFILGSDDLREELIVVTEFHAEWEAALERFTIFTSAGKMLSDKFLPASYYDVLLYTDTESNPDTGKVEKFRFVTAPTKRYPEARSMDIFDELYIENDLNLVLTKVREYIGIPIPEKKA